MPIDALLNYIKNNCLKFSVMTDTANLKDTGITDFAAANGSLRIGLPKGEVCIDISDFKQIAFDAIEHKAKTKEEFLSIIPLLEDSQPFNAYLENSNKDVIFSLVRVHS